MNDEVKRRIDDCVKGKSKTLNLGDLEIKSIPKEIKSLNWLTELNLDSNQISKIENLPESLTVLYLRSNQISKL